MKARLDSTRRGLPICGADTPVSNIQAIRSWLFWGPRSQDPGLCEGDLRSCERMPEGCLAECTLVFPLFIAGGEARDAEHVEIIRERLGMIVDLRRFKLALMFLMKCGDCGLRGRGVLMRARLTGWISLSIADGSWLLHDTYRNECDLICVLFF